MGGVLCHVLDTYTRTYETHQTLSEFCTSIFRLPTSNSEFTRGWDRDYNPILFHLSSLARILLRPNSPT